MLQWRPSTAQIYIYFKEYVEFWHEGRLTEGIAGQHSVSEDKTAQTPWLVGGTSATQLTLKLTYGGIGKVFDWRDGTSQVRSVSLAFCDNGGRMDGWNVTHVVFFPPPPPPALSCWVSDLKSKSPGFFLPVMMDYIFKKREAKKEGRKNGRRKEGRKEKKT